MESNSENESETENSGGNEESDEDKNGLLIVRQFGYPEVSAECYVTNFGSHFVVNAARFNFKVISNIPNDGPADELPLHLCSVGCCDTLKNYYNDNNNDDDDDDHDDEYKVDDDEDEDDDDRSTFTFDTDSGWSDSNETREEVYHFFRTLSPESNATYLHSNEQSVMSVTNMIRYIPEMLPYAISLAANGCHMYKNEYHLFNLRQVSFLPSLMSLAMEYKTYPDSCRYGLLVQAMNDGKYERETCLHRTGWPNTLQNLVFSRSVFDGFTGEREPTLEETILVDEGNLNVIKKLRSMNILRKEDIKEQYLVQMLLSDGKYFAEQRFEYLVDWDPSSLSNWSDGLVDEEKNHSTAPLSWYFNYYNDYPQRYGVDLKKDKKNDLPIYWSTLYDDIQIAFRAVFKAGMKHFPKEFGFVNHRNDRTGSGLSAYESACNKFGIHKVKDVMVNVIIELIEENDDGIQGTFRSVAEAGMKHFPNEIGFIRYENSSGGNGESIFENMCDKYGIDEVKKLMMDVLQESEKTTLQHMAQRKNLVQSLFENHNSDETSSSGDKSIRNGDAHACKKRKVG